MRDRLKHLTTGVAIYGAGGNVVTFGAAWCPAAAAILGFGAGAMLTSSCGVRGAAIAPVRKRTHRRATEAPRA